MPFIFIYLLKLSLSLGLVFLFYQLILRKLTFYNWNRWYLLGYSLLCFFISFIDISPVLQKNEWANSKAISWVPVIDEHNINEVVATPSYNFFTAWNIAVVVLITGMLVMFFRLLFQLVSFRKMMKKAKAIPVDGMNLFQVDEEIIPFSFGNSIFINQHLHTTEELREIIRHEFVHVKQKHSIDILWSELLCLVNWYNPFAWLLKRSIRQNLEFIADNKILENGIDKKQYQYLLLKVIGNNQFSIAPKFNFSSLKKRIAMMNKLKTAKLHLVRFLFILPLLAVILLSFRKQTGNSIPENKKSTIAVSGEFTDTIPGELNEKGYIIDVIGRRSIAMVIVKDKSGKVVERVSYRKWKENEKSYEDKFGELPPPPPPPLPPTPPDPPQPIELPENVKKIDVNNKKATVVLKDGTVEKYDLNKPEEKAAFEKKYGDVIPTPPTPPTPPVLLKLPDSVQYLLRNAEFIEIWVKDGKKESYNLKVPSEKAAFVKKYGKIPEEPVMPAQVNGEQYYEVIPAQEINRTNISNDFEITDKKATIHLKNGKTEVYDLTKTTERKNFETKYGRLITVPAKVEGGEVAVTAISTDEGRTVIAPAKVGVEGGVAFLNEEGSIITGEEEILVTITKKTTQQQLEGFVKQMKEKGVELKFDNVDYNDGILVSISGSIKFKDNNGSYKDSHGNFSVTDFNKLVLSTIKNGEHVYFKVRTTDNKVVI